MIQLCSTLRFQTVKENYGPGLTTRRFKIAYYKARLFIQVPRDVSLSGVLVTTLQYTWVHDQMSARLASANLTIQH